MKGERSVGGKRCWGVYSHQADLRRLGGKKPWGVWEKAFPVE